VKRRKPTTRVAQAIEIADEVAHQMFHRFRREVPLDEIKSLALPAAIAAAERWDGRGWLPKYVVQRTRWAVLDGLRRERRRAKLVSPAALSQMAALSTERAAEVAASTDEDAAERPEPAAAFRALLQGAAAGFTVELDAAGALAVPDPNEDVEANVERLRVLRAVAELPEPERSVLERHGYAGETFDEIAAAADMHRSTVFSVYTRALEKLRQSFEGPT
jgi:RNA polymerase sigma factor (sigma-70 family)